MNDELIEFEGNKYFKDELSLLISNGRRQQQLQLAHKLFEQWIYDKAYQGEVLDAVRAAYVSAIIKAQEFWPVAKEIFKDS